MSSNIINDDFVNRKKFYSQESTIITDPPFNIGYHYDSCKDKLNKDDYMNLLSNRIEGFNNRVIIAYPEIVFAYSLHIQEPPLKTVSWVYNANTPKQHRMIAWFGFEPNFKLSGQPYKNPKDKRVKKLIEQGKQARLYDWWEIQQVKNVSKEKTEHPCQMPLEVMDRIVKISNPKFVIDPFVGSGTTALAAENNNIDFAGFDISADYCEIARKRLNNASSSS